MKARISFQTLNFHQDEFPKVDCILLSHVLMDWPLETKKMLIRKAYDALPNGGIVVVCDEMIDNERSKNLSSLLVSLHM
jgi:chemotaxis methyl-accepting protein methylase